MAGESTYNTISSLVNNITEAALLTAREQSVLDMLVRNFTDSTSMTPRVFHTYTGGTIVELAEVSDMSAQAFTPAASGTITPSLWAQQYYLTDARIASDFSSVQGDAAADLGGVFATKVESAIAAVFDDLTGGTVGSAGGTLTWANVQRAAAYLRANLAPQPYTCVLRPEQWYYLASASSGVPTLMVSQDLMNNMNANFYVSSALGIDFYIDGNISSGTAAVGAMFSSDAIAYDLRRAFKIETQRDASRGGGGWELNATMVFGAGVYRPTWGVQMIGTSS